MAKFYGTIQGNRGLATRCGNARLKSTAQSYDGSVIVILTYNTENELNVCIEIDDDSSDHGEKFFEGSIKELKDKLAK